MSFYVPNEGSDLAYRLETIQNDKTFAYLDALGEKGWYLRLYASAINAYIITEFLKPLTLAAFIHDADPHYFVMARLSFNHVYRLANTFLFGFNPKRYESTIDEMFCSNNLKIMLVDSNTNIVHKIRDEKMPDLFLNQLKQMATIGYAQGNFEELYRNWFATNEKSRKLEEEIKSSRISKIEMLI